MLDDGSVQTVKSWKYFAIKFPNPVDVSKFGSVQFEGDVSAKWRVCFKNKSGVFFITSPKTKDEWSYPNGFTGKYEWKFEGSGYADYLILGTTSEDVNFKLTSITLKAGAGAVNTDGLTEAMKEVGENNPIAVQRFMADPYAIEYEGTVYVYGTNDSQAMIIGEDGNVPLNSYSYVNTLNCYSSKDMVNWTDEGIIQVAGKNGPANWARNSWAPAVAHKKINGKDKFFIYFADNGSGIGVLEGDSPTGPWRDPIGKQLISRDTPNCSGSEVPWLFDPAVLVDDDGQGYLYFGGIGEAEDRDHPRCNRVVKLADDMVHLAGDPVEIDAPGAFEDSGINKFGDKYYYSYCTNWDGGAEKRPDSAKLGIASIAYMVSDSPMGPFEDAKVVMKNPTSFFTLPSNEFNNNHHCMLEKDGQIYMFYHTQKLSDDLGYTRYGTDKDGKKVCVGGGFRTTGIDLVTVGADGSLSADMTMEGVDGIADFDPYRSVEAETFAWSKGTSTIVGPAQENTRNNRVLSSIDTGDYVGLDSVAFGEDGAASLTMSIAATESGTVEVYVDDMTAANKVGTLDVYKTADAETFAPMSVNFDQKITGTHKLFFVYQANDILVDTWSFSKDSVEIVVPEPETAESITLEGVKLKPVEGQGNNWAVQDDGSVQLTGAWQYYAIAFDAPVELSKYQSVEINGKASANFRLSFKDKAGKFFIMNADDWKYPAAFDGTTEVSFEGSGEADYFLLGTTGNDVNFNITSITLKAK